MPRGKQQGKQQQRPKPQTKGGKTTEERKEKVDPMLVGFNWSSYGDDAKKTPYDFITDPSTGRRPGQGKEPYGHTINDFRHGWGSYEVVPPLAIWVQGLYLVDLPKEKQEKYAKMREYFANLDGRINDEWECWVVPGEGTPGNWEFRIYKLPKDVAKDPLPKHPFMWPEHLRKRTYGGSFQGRPWGSGDGTPAGGKPVTTTTSSAPKLPVGIRFRCACGHWFKESDLAAHAKNCCPATSTDLTTEWAMMCAPECGCDTLDEVSVCKPGFPKKKPVVTESKGEVVEPGNSPSAA